MSSAIERLKALAEAKRASESSQVTPTHTTPSEESTHVQPESSIPDSPASSSSSTDLSNGSVSNEPVPENSQEVPTSGTPAESNNCSDSGNLANECSDSGLVSDHPLKMQLAELEQALTEKLPEFRTILRDIHSKLRQDPAIVTAMSEEEVALVVSGLVAHANLEVIAPNAIKAAKKATRGVKIEAGDL